MINEFVFINKGESTFGKKFYNDSFFGKLREYYISFLNDTEVEFEDQSVSLLKIRNNIIKWIGRDLDLLVSRETKKITGDKRGNYLSINSVCGPYITKLKDFLDKYIMSCEVIGNCISRFSGDDGKERVFSS